MVYICYTFCSRNQNEWHSRHFEVFCWHSTKRLSLNSKLPLLLLVESEESRVNWIVVDSHSLFFFCCCCMDYFNHRCWWYISDIRLPLHSLICHLSYLPYQREKKPRERIASTKHSLSLPSSGFHPSCSPFTAAVVQFLCRIHSLKRYNDDKRWRIIVEWCREEVLNLTLCFHFLTSSHSISNEKKM